MTKALLYIVCLLVPVLSWEQRSGSSKELKKTWKEINERHGFRKSKDFEGPETDRYVSPSDINGSQPFSAGSGSSHTTPYQGLPYSSQQIQRGRQQNPGNPGGPRTGSGNIAQDPHVSPPEPVDVPKIDSPDLDAPDLDAPDMSGNFWKILGIILLLILVAFIIYSLLRNRTPGMKAIPFQPLEEDLNPATITKTELELRLEEASNRGDYRECVRIYFLFAMKELIAKRWIVWKKEKTNIHYVIEMHGKPTAAGFEEVVSIYDLVWYGDYVIDETAYRTMQPTLDAYYKLVQRQQ